MMTSSETDLKSYQATLHSDTIIVGLSLSLSLSLSVHAVKQLILHRHFMV